MPVSTIADLIENGFDFEVQQYLAGNVAPGMTLESLALRTFGADWQGTPETLSQFAAGVQSAMNAADNLTEEGLPPGFVVPGVPLTPGGPEFRVQGYMESVVPDQEQTIAPPNVHVPFQIDADTVPTPMQILDMIRNDESFGAGALAHDSPGLAKRLEQLHLDSLAGVNRDWEVSVERIWRNIRHQVG